MPQATASRPILNASANYQATDWAAAEGRAGLDFRASAELKRGFNLELGAEALVGLDANLSKFLSVDVQGHANAAAQVRAQVQVPLDLFDEAGLAIRLQAMAEAAAGIELGIGLNVGEFLALAGTQPGMQGMGLRLLRIFLDEAQIGGGVMAKAAAAAMAYANIAITGKLIDSPSQRAGFNVSCEAGVGLKAGAGYRVFASFGLADPSRMIRRTVDALVDDTLKRLADRTNDVNLLTMLDGLRAPAKMALRTNFELGVELAKNSGTFNAAQAPVIAQRCLQVFFEEAQRYVIQQVADHAIRTFTRTLQTAGFSVDAWERAHAERIALATRLRNQPADPFEPSDENKSYWLGVVNDSEALAIALGAPNHHTAPWVASISTLWAATQLLFATVGRISSGGARASALNASANTRFPPYTGPTVQSAPRLVRLFFDNLRPSGSRSRNPTLEELVARVGSATVLDPLVAEYPALKVVLEIVGGPGANSANTIRTLLNNLGPFISAGATGVDPQRSIEVILEGLRRYVNVQLQNEIEPALQELFADSPDELRLYLSEVVIPTLRFATNVIFTEASSWSTGNNSVQKALREACSALVMQLLGRTLVVTTDILFDKALQEISGAFHEASSQLNRRGGVIDKLDDLVPALDRQAIKDTVEEIFDIAADVFEPLPSAKRTKLRQLLLEIIDTVPPSPDAEFLEALKTESFIPNLEAARELALELGGLIADSFTRLIRRIIELLADAIFEALEAIIEAIENEVKKWVEGIETLLEDLRLWLDDVFLDLGRLHGEVRVFGDNFLDQTENFLGLLAGSKRGSARTAILDAAYDTGKSLLPYVFGYNWLSRDDKRKVKNALYEFLDNLLNEEIFDDVTDALRDIAGDIEGFIEDARNIDPEDDVAGELIELLTERVEIALNENFGSRVSIPVSFNVWLGWTFEVPLGEIRIYTSDVIDMIQYLVRHATAFTSAADGMADNLSKWLKAEFDLDKSQADWENWTSQQELAQAQANETKSATPSILILEPGASAAYPGNVNVEIALMDTPRSFLGLEESETSRVFVFLDETPLDLDQFAVADGTVTLTSAVTGPEADGNLPARNRLVEQSTFTRLASVRPAPNPLSAVRVKPFKQRQEVRSNTRTQVHMNGKNRQGAAIGKPGPGKSIQIGGRQERGNSRGRIGGKPRASHKREVIETVVPSLMLRATFPKQDLIEGFHTLTVTATTGDKATRVSESVVFYTSPAAVQPSRGGKGNVKMPVREPFAIERLVPALRELAAKGAGRTVRIGPTDVKTPKVVRLATKGSKEAIEKSRARIEQKLKAKSSRVAELRKVLKPLPEEKTSPKEKPSLKETPEKVMASPKTMPSLKKNPVSKKRASSKKSNSRRPIK